MDTNVLFVRAHEAHGFDATAFRITQALRDFFRWERRSDGEVATTAAPPIKC